MQQQSSLTKAMQPHKKIPATNRRVFWLSLALAASHLLTTNAHAKPTMPTAASATSAPTTLADASKQAQAQDLAHSTAWLRLLYYPTPYRTGSVSRVATANNPLANQQAFFASPDGGHDPAAELQATLGAMFMPNPTPDASVYCRMPARVHWLKTTLAIPDHVLPSAECPTLARWQAKLAAQGASIIFADEYLADPQSAFAHSFLRFDTPDSARATYLNYTPKKTDGESFAKFTYKAVIAGTPGEFTLNNYAQKITGYTEEQGRNVWTYRLNLSPAEVEQLTRQVWEIQGQNLTYKLLSDNCASEILALLDALRPRGDLLNGLQPLVAPAQIVRHLAANALLTTREFVPSRVARAQAVRNTKVLKAVNADSEPYGVPLAPNSHALQNTPQQGSRSDPLLANPLQQVSVGVEQVKNRNTHDALTLGYRMVYHDALDKPDGYPIGATLTALSGELRVPTNQRGQHDSVEFNHITIMQMRALNPVNTAKQGNSWGAKFSFERVQDGIRHDDGGDIVGNLSGEYGKSWAYGTPRAPADLPPNICYALGTAALQGGRGLYHGYRAGVGATGGCLQQISPDWRALATFDLPLWLAGDNKHERYAQPRVEFGTQYDFDRHNALRVTLSRQWTLDHGFKQVADTTQDSIGLRYLRYFD